MEKMILIPRGMILPEISTLNSKILKAYKESIESYKWKALNSLNIFKDEAGDLIGSNYFAPIKLRELFPETTRLATTADLGRAAEINPNFFKEFLSDTGLVLRTAGDSYKNNDFLAKDLAEQLRKREITLKYPKIIYFDALDLREDSNSAYGLAYNLNEKTKLEGNIINAPKLNHKNDRRKVSEISDKGLPMFNRNGKIILNTREDGLSGFCFGKSFGECLRIYSLDQNLTPPSSKYARVVVVNLKDVTLER